MHWPEADQCGLLYSEARGLGFRLEAGVLMKLVCACGIGGVLRFLASLE